MRKIRMTPENRRRSAVVAATGMAALLGAGVFAVPAAAHTGTWSVSCDSVTVHLTAYNKRATNSVTLSVEGGGVLAKEDSFGAGYDFSSPLPPHDAAITLHLVVTAGDSAKYNIDQEKTAAPCEGQTTAPPPPTTTPAPPPTTTPAPPATTTPATTPPTTAPPAPPTTAPATPTASTNAPVVAGSASASAAGGLAETGSSNATPVIAGIAAAAVVVGGGALVLSRRRRSSSHR
ncbi:LAETG motif-containing sortase-dependent surface protein [Streptomyces sp. NBC_01190]|uniref:LAETG motif-containing sortase-dependent surface protein n=1 Tax=Streptomyces sp. NBC_01190 TaxID=2903767 RepID=UPI003865DBE4|nr:LPXTG cell wall anchor domain-containing protein [Streptomyces sp. NBC_01190]